MNTSLNPVVMKVDGGTINSQTNLCATCRYRTERQSAISGKVSVLCDVNYNRPFVLLEPIGRCNRYLASDRLTLNEMGEIAWIVEARGKHIGFLSPEEMQRRLNQPPKTGF